MNDNDEPSENKFLVPTARHTLACRSDALVKRGIRDLEAMEHAQRFLSRAKQSIQLHHESKQKLEQSEVSPSEQLSETSDMPWGGYFDEQTEDHRHEPLVEGNTERILIVEEEETVRDIISLMLKSAGYRCQAVAGGLDAIALLDSGEEFDLVTTDLLNSPWTGIDVLLSMKEKFPDIPVVVVSALNDDSVEKECFRIGAGEYLRKPFDREQLLATVNRALNHNGKKLESDQ
jgi:CheY-like chemotaxis protein